jgi:penicillin-binding protein 1A
LAPEAIPPTLIHAVLAAEDDRFFQHNGVDYPGLARATIRHLLSGKKSEGGSTITMQLTRGVFLSPEKSYRRKLSEIFLTLRIEQQFSKEEILTLYLNKSFLGQRAYGIGAAAEVYFGKTVDQLTIPEIALIAGTFRLPSRDNPVANPEFAKQRRSYVLRRMREKNYISQAEYETALATPVESKLHDPAIELDAPYVAEMVRVDLLNRIGPKAFTDGYTAVTSLDSKLQRAADDAVRAGLIEYDQRHGYRGPVAKLTLAPDTTPQVWERALDDYPTRGGLEPALVIAVGDQNATAYGRQHGRMTLALGSMRWARPALADGAVGKSVEKVSDVLQVGDVVYVAQDTNGNWNLLQVPAAQGALVSLDPTDGGISALVGGFDYNGSNFNRAVQAKRQPGSSFKPLLYSAALEHGFTPATIVNDAPIVFEDSSLEGEWKPQNNSRTSLGPVRVREALYKSLNQVSIRIMHALGPAYVSEYVQRFGLTPEELPPNLSLALGTTQVSPLRMATAYSVFANGGYLVEPYFIDRIEDPTGAVIYAARPKFACVSCAGATMPATAANDDPNSPSPTASADNSPNATAKQTVTPQNVYLMTDMLMDVIKRGTATRALELKRSDIAGKTGTTQDGRDTWFCGFNADLVGVAWVGFDQERPLGPGEQGGRTALPIWMKFMGDALNGRPEHRLPEPPGLVTMRISSVTGKPTRSGDPNTIFEKFIATHLPEVDATDNGETSPTETAGDKEKSDDPLF